MKFQKEHNQFFDAKSGAFSEVTGRENIDSQITLDQDEKAIFTNFFGSSNIHHGRVASNPTLASKEFLLYPTMNTIKLNLVFPKPNKAELRLYMNEEYGFKPSGDQVWFAYLNRSNRLVIGAMTAKEWKKISQNENPDQPQNTSNTLTEKTDDLEVLLVNKYSFQPGAMSIIQMGQELIGHPSTAINELVKNSYDADATVTKVYLHHDTPQSNKSFAIISDNGTGMSDNTLFGSWLQPSVSSKRGGNGLSEVFKRNLLGNKGIGRLAAMSLGESVTVVTKQKNDSTYNWITVNRESFKVAELLSQIKFPGAQIDRAERIFLNESLLEERGMPSNTSLVDFLTSNELYPFSQGTLIIVEKLDNSVLDILTKDFLSESEDLNSEQFSYKNTTFYKELAMLVTPISLTEKIEEELVEKNIIPEDNKHAIKRGEFNLELGINLMVDEETNQVDWLPVVAIPVHSVFDYRVFGKVTNKREVKGLFVYNRITEDQREEQFELSSSEMNEKEEKVTLFNQNYTSEVGEYYFDIRIYDMGESDNVDKLSFEAGFHNKSQFRAAFKNFQGLRVSKNGFGVKPYGEEVEDWIGLSKARVMDPGHNVNTNQILGYVFFFSPQNDKLEEKTNREGFLENAAFNQVKADLKKIFKNLGIRRYNYRVQHNLGRLPKSRHSRPDFEAYLEFMNANNSLSQIRKYSEGFMEEVRTSMDNLEESLSFSERLASLGSGIELVYHEMAQPIAGLKTTRSSLNLKKEKIEEGAKKNFLFDLEAMAHSTSALVELQQSLQPAIGKSRPKLFRPFDTFLKVCSLFKSDLNEAEISLKADTKTKDHEIKDLEYAFWVSFLNIVNNAVYWIKKDGKGREIRLNIHSDENMRPYEIVISNNVSLINPAIIDTLFEYGVTDKTEGTGLGLAFTRSILSKIGWEIVAMNTTDGPAFTIKRTK